MGSGRAHTPGTLSARIRCESAAVPVEPLERRILMDASGPRAAANVVLRPGDIIVADIHAFGGGGGIIRVDPATGEQTPVSSGGLFENPIDVAVDRDGTLLVVDTSPDRIDRLIRVDPATGGQTVVSADNNFVSPFGLVIEPAGTVLVADLDRLIRVDPATGAQSVVPVASPAFVQDLVLDAAGNLLAVYPTRGGGQVYRIDPVTGASTAVASGFSNPEGLAIEADGNIVVADPRFLDGSPAVVRVDPATGGKTVLASGGDLLAPVAVAVEADGHILVSDPNVFDGAGGVFRIDPVTGAQSLFAGQGFFNFPSGIAVAGPAAAAVVGRHVFYNGSSFDGNEAGANAADDAAIAADKAALRPGQAPTFANVTSYLHGLNGVMVDIADLPAASVLTPDDFEVGGDGTRVGAVSVRRGAGVNGSDRVTLTWPDYDTPTDPPTIAVGNGWLTVTVKANANTGLASPDVFSFGNLIGESGDGSGAAGWRVNALDLAAVKRAMNSATSIASATDFNRDGRTNALDLAIVRRTLGQVLAPPLRMSDALSARRVADDILA